MTKMIESYGETSDDNAKFAEVMKRWLETKAVRGAVGVLIIAQLRDGFDLLGLGPQPVSQRELEDYLVWCAEQLLEARAAQT